MRGCDFNKLHPCAAFHGPYKAEKPQHSHRSDPGTAASSAATSGPGDKMAGILRLQGLAAEADAQDIRTLFKDFFIPDGGVYIVGGSLREAFIAFPTERDALLAKQKTGTCLKGDKVGLHTSSMAELENKLRLLLNSKEQKLQRKTKEKVHLKMSKTSNMKRADKKLYLKTKEEKLTMDEKLKMKNQQMKRVEICQRKEVKTPQTTMQEKLKMKKEKLNRKREEKAGNTPSPTPHGGNAHTHHCSSLSCDSPPPDPRLATMQQSLNANTQPFLTPAVEKLDPNTAFLLGVCTVLQGLKSSSNGQKSGAEQSVEFPTGDVTSVVADGPASTEPTLDSSPGFVRLFGAPASTTKQDICKFFTGLKVDEAIVNTKFGLGHGCLVKFASTEDACEALQFNNQPMGHICVEVRGATERMWTTALQDCENRHDAKREASHSLPLRETATSEQTLASSFNKRKRIESQRPPKKPRLEGDQLSPSSTEYVVMARNLPKIITKTEAMDLFKCPNLGHRNVLHLLDKNDNRTDTVFFIFNCPEDYNNAIGMNGYHVNSSPIEVSLITKEAMREKMAKNGSSKCHFLIKRRLRSA